MHSNRGIYEEIKNKTDDITGIINTHSHFSADTASSDISLHELLQMTYISWSYPWFEDTPGNRILYEDTMYTNSYFYWMRKAVGELYCDKSPLSPENWENAENNFRKANSDNNHKIRILKDICGYSSVILDNYTDPGSDRGLPGLISPAYRCDGYLHGYSFSGHDSNNNNPYRMMGLDKKPESIDEYVSSMEKQIEKMKANGCVALKIAIAYERGIDFTNDDREKAVAAYSEKSPDESEIKDFQDYIMFSLCKIAAKNNMPVQIHTGLGKLEKSNALGLKKLIEKNPETKFSLFHCGYPWMDDVLGLLHNYKNVYPDLCWLPLISTGAAIRFIREALEVGDSSRLCWGCDTWTPQESLGALMAVKHCLSIALASMCDEGILSIPEAVKTAEKILKDNPRRLYGL